MKNTMEVFEATTTKGDFKVQGYRLSDWFAYTVSVDEYYEDVDEYDGTIIHGKPQVLTHIPTKRHVMSPVKSRPKAQKMADYLESLDVDWSEADEEKLVAMVAATEAPVQEKLREIQFAKPKRRKQTLFQRINASKEWQGSELTKIENREFLGWDEPQPCAYIVHPSGAEAWVRLEEEDMT